MSSILTAANRGILLDQQLGQKHVHLFTISHTWEMKHRRKNGGVNELVIYFYIFAVNSLKRQLLFWRQTLDFICGNAAQHYEHSIPKQSNGNPPWSEAISTSEGCSVRTSTATLRFPQKIQQSMFVEFPMEFFFLPPMIHFGPWNKSSWSTILGRGGRS